MVSQAAIQNYFSAQFSVCKAVNYLHLLCLFKHLNSMNGVQAHFENTESLRNPAAGNSGRFPLKAAFPPTPPPPQQLSFTTILPTPRY